MADQTGRDQNTGKPAVLDCEQWEAMLADKMDAAALKESGVPGSPNDPADPLDPVHGSGSSSSAFSPESEAAFAEHSRHCPGCGDLLEQARKGQQWLRLLGAHAPAPPVYLLSTILEKTRGAGHATDFPIGATSLAGDSLPVTPAGRWTLPFLPATSGVHMLRRAHNARMLMTAAMAFFSVALTLSLSGVRLTSVHAAELRPQAVEANVTRSFYGTKKQVVSFYENLRLVYEVESKMQDLRRNVDEQAAPIAPKPLTPAPGARAPQPKAHGSAGRDGRALTGQSPQQVVHGWPQMASFSPASGRPLAGSTTAGRNLFLGPVSRGRCSTRLQGATSKERNRI